MAAQPESQPESLARRVLRLLETADLGNAMISERLGQKRVSGPLNETIRQLTSNGMIEMTIPSNPGSRLQKYRVTTKGRAQLRS